MTARILEVSEDGYHNDPCAVPSLSASIAHTLISECPEKAYAAHPRLGGVRRDPTKAMDAGTLIHKLLLREGKEIAVIDAPDFRTKDAREQRADAYLAGRLPVLQHDYAEKLAIAEILRERLAARGFEFTGQSEVAVEWTDVGTNGPVLCRSRFDHVFLDQGVIYDLKKCASSRPRDLARHLVDYGYDIQFEAYRRALAQLRPEFEGRVQMTFLFVEIEPPYSVVPATLDGAFREIGDARWSNAVHMWERCLETGFWPGYCNGVATLQAPRWVIAEHLETMEAA